MSTNVQCKLCLGNDRLRRSHVLSEFVYRDLYDEYHRFYDLATADGNDILFQQKCLRETLFCERCETQLSIYETYVAPLLRRPGGLAISSSREEIVNKVDYEKFKLFQLSILWRAHIAEHPLFRKVDVGSKHGENLRKMLLVGDPGESHEYGCLMAAANIDDRPMADFIGPSIHLKKDGHHHYALIFAGFVWSFIVSSHSQTYSKSRFCLQRDGSLILFPFDMSKSPGFLKIAFEIYEANKQGIEKLQAAKSDSAER